MNRPMPPKPGTTTKPAPRPGPGQAKTFTIEQWDGSKTGEKIILYAGTGMGKTTLASMAPNPVFIPTDDGGRKIKNPQTGEWLRVVKTPDGMLPKTFEDVRRAANNCLELNCETVVQDTGTKLEEWAEDYVLRTVPGPQGSTCKNLEGYGYNKGIKHLYDAMRLPLLDFDRLVEAGKNVIIICQSVSNKIANPAGEDFLRDEPRLNHDRKWSVLSLYQEWADHIFRLDYQGTWVKKKTKDANFGKVSGDTTRIVQTKEETYFKAKSRTLDDPVIAFSTKDDDSLWQLLFNNN